MQEKRIVETDSENKSHNDKPAVFRLMNEENPPQEVLLPFHFDESYFTESGGSKNHNKQLATMSCILACSAFSHFREGEKRYLNQDADLRYLLTGEAGDRRHEYPDYKKYETTPLGFVNYQEDAFYHMKSTENSIAFSFAAKEMSFGILICVVIRGGGYENEWCSNFNVQDNSIGEKKYHKGFYDASSKVLLDLNRYIEKYLGKRIKLWIVGYSRGGAVANITAHRISTEWYHMKWKIDGSSIYTYAFEPPTGIMSNNHVPEHLVIHNHINYLDLVTRFALKSWKFVRVGNNYIFPKATDENFNEHWTVVVKCMQQFIKQDPKHYTDLSIGKGNYITIDNIEEIIGLILKTPEVFMVFYKELSYLTQWLMSLTSEEMNEVKNFQNINNLWNAIYYLCKGKLEEAKQDLKKFWLAVCPKRSEAELNAFIDNILNLKNLFKLFIEHNPVNFLLILLYCMILPWTHSPMLCLSWLMSQDSNYSSKLSEIAIETVEPSQFAEQLSSLFTELESCDDHSAQEEIITNWLSRHS